MLPYIVTQSRGFQIVVCVTPSMRTTCNNTQSSNTEGEPKQTSASLTVHNTQKIF